MLQSTAYTCGPAALATLLRMISGGDDYYRQITEIVQIDQTGTSMLSLKQSATMLGYNAAGYRLDIANLKTSGPVVAHVVINGYHHFTVVERIADGFVYMADPTLGRIAMPLEHFEYVWSGAVLKVSGMEALQQAAVVYQNEQPANTPLEQSPVNVEIAHPAEQPAEQATQETTVTETETPDETHQPKTIAQPANPYVPAEETKQAEVQAETVEQATSTLLSEDNNAAKPSFYIEAQTPEYAGIQPVDEAAFLPAVEAAAEETVTIAQTSETPEVSAKQIITAPEQPSPAELAITAAEQQNKEYIGMELKQQTPIQPRSKAFGPLAANEMEFIRGRAIVRSIVRSVQAASSRPIVRSVQAASSRIVPVIQNASRRELILVAGGIIGGVLGAMGGAGAAGALASLKVPVIGTTAGMVVGGIFGGLAGVKEGTIRASNFYDVVWGRKVSLAP